MFAHNIIARKSFPFTSLKCKLMRKYKFSTAENRKQDEKISPGWEKVSSDFFLCTSADDAALMIFTMVNVSKGKKENIIPSFYLLHICMNVYMFP